MRASSKGGDNGLTATLQDQVNADLLAFLKQSKRAAAWRTALELEEVRRTMNDFAEFIDTFVTGESWVAKDTSERRPAHKAVAELAHYLYEVRGKQDGHDVEDWLRAESLLAHGLAESRL